jgi:hypothetical protein
MTLRRRVALPMLLMVALLCVGLFAAVLNGSRPRVHERDANDGLLGLLLGGFFLSATAAIKVLGNEQAFDSHDEFEPDGGPTFVRRIDWTPLLIRDPAFSPIVFEDFVHRLYKRAHEARGETEALARLARYLSTETRRSLASRELTGVRINKVVIGSMQVTSLQLGADLTRIDLRFRSNVSAADASWYLVEEWQLARDAKVQSKPPDRARSLSGPYPCGEVDGGRFDWFVIGMRLREAQWWPPDLGDYMPESGTELPSLVSPSFHERWGKLLADDPEVDRYALLAHVRMIHERLDIAWTAQDLEIVRPFMSDAMHDQLTYWLEAYRRQGLINCLEDTQIERIELVKLQRDAWFDALTVRVFARGLDYTIREIDDWVVGGSPSTPRRYSEYWTMVRGAHVRGELDWVVSRIETAENYLG